MNYVADWQDPCWQYRLWRCASDTVPMSLRMSFGRGWTGVEIFVDQLFTQVWTPVEEIPSNSFE